MSHNLFDSLQEFKYGGKTGRYYSLAALEKAGLGKVLAPAAQPARRARIGAAQLRRQENHRSASEESRRTGSRNGERTEEVPVRRRARAAAGHDRRAAGRRLRRDARGGQGAGQGPRDHRAAVPRAPDHRPLGADRHVRHRRRARARTWRSSSSATASATSS